MSFHHSIPKAMINQEGLKNALVSGETTGRKPAGNCLYLKGGELCHGTPSQVVNSIPTIEMMVYLGQINGFVARHLRKFPKGVPELAAALISKFKHVNPQQVAPEELERFVAMIRECLRLMWLSTRSTETEVEFTKSYFQVTEEKRSWTREMGIEFIQVLKDKGIIGQDIDTASLINEEYFVKRKAVDDGNNVVQKKTSGDNDENKVKKVKPPPPQSSSIKKRKASDVAENDNDEDVIKKANPSSDDEDDDDKNEGSGGGPSTLGGGPSKPSKDEGGPSSSTARKQTFNPFDSSSESE